MQIQRPDLAAYVGRVVHCLGEVTEIDGEYVMLSNVSFHKDENIEFDILKKEDIPEQNHIWCPKLDMLLRHQRGDRIILHNVVINSYHRGYTVDSKGLVDVCLQRTFPSPEGTIIQLSVRRYIDSHPMFVISINYGEKQDTGSWQYWRMPSLHLIEFEKEYPFLLAMGFAMERFGTRMMNVISVLKKDSLLTPSSLKELWHHQAKLPTTDSEKLIERIIILFNRVIEGKVMLQHLDENNGKGFES